MCVLDSLEASQKFQTFLIREGALERSKNLYLRKAKEYDIPEVYTDQDIKVVGVIVPIRFGRKKTVKDESEVDSDAIVTRSIYQICLTRDDTWCDFIHQIKLLDQNRPVKHRCFKHSLDSLFFSNLPAYCLADKRNLIKPNDKPFDVIADNSKVFIQKIIYKKGCKKVNIVTCKCRCGVKSLC